MLLRRVIPLLAAMLLIAQADAQTKLAILTAGGRTYTNVVVLGFNTTDLYFTYATGIANVKLRLLEPELQAKFRYDAATAAQAEKQQVEDDKRYKETVRDELEAEATRNSAAARNDRAWAELALQDPIGHDPLLHVAAAALQVEKWFGPKPDTQGRLMLVVFWSVRSAASRAVLPQLNSWNKTYAGKILIVGVTSDTERDLAQAEPKPDFTSGSDPEGKLATAMTIRTLPCCVLIDPQGYVRFHGHPAALDDKKLQGIFARVSE